MRYGIGSTILILASLYYTLKGLIGLYKFKRYKSILGHLSFIAIYPIILFYTLEFVKSLEISGTLKILTMTPVIIFVPVWLLYGFFVNKNYENAKMTVSSENIFK